jgi:alpha-ribazole phosphatase
MLKVTFIRHFATQGNLQKKYIGITDEPLCEEGKLIVQCIHYPEAAAVFASPMIRCVETAKLIYPNHTPRLVDGFRECYFGDFENKNYKELRTNPLYQAWVDSNATLPFPNGEDILQFKERSIKAFDEVIDLCLERGFETIAVVVHGGTIMSIFERYANPKRGYFHWQVGNGCGYTVEMKAGDRRLYKICTVHSLP